MVWAATAVAAVGVVSSYMGAQQASADANRARRSGEKAARNQLQMEQQKLDFAKEQYDDWDDIYGPAQERMAQFYNNLTPDQLAATGLQKQAETFAQVRAGTKRTAAQKGINSPALDMMEQQIDIEEAKGKAQIRADAPGKVAQMQGGFVAAGKGAANPYGSAVMGAQGSMGATYGGAANMAFQREAQANQAGANAWGAIGQGLQTGISAYTRSQANKQYGGWDPNSYDSGIPGDVSIG